MPRQSNYSRHRSSLAEIRSETRDPSHRMYQRTGLTHPWSYHRGRWSGPSPQDVVARIHFLESMVQHRCRAHTRDREDNPCAAAANDWLDTFPIVADLSVGAIGSFHNRHLITDAITVDTNQVTWAFNVFTRVRLTRCTRPRHSSSLQHSLRRIHNRARHPGTRRYRAKMRDAWARMY